MNHTGPPVPGGGVGPAASAEAGAASLVVQSARAPATSSSGLVTAIDGADNITLRAILELGVDNVTRRATLELSVGNRDNSPRRGSIRAVSLDPRSSAIKQFGALLWDIST